jgi:outer membrane beta-barrel protein
MKSLILGFLTLLVFNLNTALANSKKLSEDINALGGNATLLQLSSDINPDKKVRVVQNRLVRRDNRFEIAARYAQRFGGDAYLQTQAFQANIEYHVNPRFSFGLIYSDYGNQLSPEGSRVFSEARASLQAGGGLSSFPDVDAPQNSVIGQIQFYPIYGKINFFDKSIIQFDVSLIAGVGTINLASGSTQLLSTGIGGGFWITQNISARAEVRYESYKDRDSIYNTTRSLNPVSGIIGLGILL